MDWRTEQDAVEPLAQDGWFKTTHWTVVLEAGRQDPILSHAALAKLCQTYWSHLYAYIRRRGHGQEDAQDLTQEFFARLLAKDYLIGASPEKGKFRSFLLTALKGFLANEWDRANRLKRGNGKAHISLDAAEAEGCYMAEPVDEMTPERIYERQWARTVLDRVMGQLGQEFCAEGKGRLFEELRLFLAGDSAMSTSYAEMGQRLGMSEGALRINAHRLRQRYRELLRLEIGNTVSSPDAIDDEIRCLFRAIS